mmetsp:Transcript_26170/g.36847  ORF Transcript_26170/g.36847 Transcript_26170/m.36847 type:complete len:438 (-) Transcript_26170:162-1475(-)
MARADVSDAAIKDALTEIKNNSSSTNWILLGYAPKSDTKLVVVGKGDGGFNECIENFNDGKVLFALVSWTVNNIKKFVYISWCGEGVVGMKKGLFNNHANDVSALFKGFHVQVNARNEDDLNEKVISEKVKKAGGASYDSGAKVQGAAERVPTNVAQGRQQAAQSNAEKKSVDRSDYSKKNESESFWTQQKQDEERRKQDQLAAKSQPKTDYQKSEERAQFWAQQSQEQPTSAPQRTQPQPSGSTASARSRFENQNQTQQAPPPSRPAPAKKATQPPKQPEPEPEPEPQQQYEPEPQQEAYAEPVQDDQGYSQEQPAQDEWAEDNNQAYSEPPAQTEQTEYAEPEQQYEEPVQQEAEYADQQYSDQQYSDQQYAEQSGGILCQARAIYEYQGENETDLSFAEGEIINVLDKSDPSGWWQGEINGRVGFFPSNFIEEI